MQIVSPANANQAFVQQTPNGALTLSAVAFRFLTNIVAAINGTTTSGVAQNILGNGVTISRGSGSPEGKVQGAIGDLYLNVSGGAGTVLYVKEADSGLKNGWQAK